jgi:hypothetical protein
VPSLCRYLPPPLVTTRLTTHPSLSAFLSQFRIIRSCTSEVHAGPPQAPNLVLASHLPQRVEEYGEEAT